MERPRFLCDRMLGRLCRKLRLLGFDAALNGEGEAGRFLLRAAREKRIAVTAARRANDRPGPAPVVLRTAGAVEQLAELFAAIGGAPPLEPFTRCIECNEFLVEEPAAAAAGRVPPLVAERFDRFHRCPACDRIYWEGSHFEAMTREVERIRRALGEQ